MMHGIICLLAISNSHLFFYLNCCSPGTLLIPPILFRSKPMLRLQSTPISHSLLHCRLGLPVCYQPTKFSLPKLYSNLQIVFICISMSDNLIIIPFQKRESLIRISQNVFIFIRLEFILNVELIGYLI